MNIKTTIEIPEEIMLSLRESEKEVTEEMKKATALKYYKDKKLSLGQCASLANMSEEDFIEYLSTQKVSIFNLSNEELLEDVKNA